MKEIEDNTQALKSLSYLGIGRERFGGQSLLSDETKPQGCRRKTLGVNSGASRPSTYHYLPAIIVWIFKRLCDTMLSIKASETII